MRVRGAGTLLNMATILLGSGLGVALRGRLPERTRSTVTDALGELKRTVASASRLKHGERPEWARSGPTHDHEQPVHALDSTLTGMVAAPRKRPASPEAAACVHGQALGSPATWA